MTDGGEYAELELNKIQRSIFKGSTELFLRHEGYWAVDYKRNKSS